MCGPFISPQELNNITSILNPLFGAVIKALGLQNYPFVFIKSSTVVIGDIHGRFDLLKSFVNNILTIDDARYSGV